MLRSTRRVLSSRDLISESGQRLTPYQWKVYDYLLSVPAGRVTTYKGITSAVGGSPRSGQRPPAMSPIFTLTIVLP